MIKNYKLFTESVRDMMKPKSKEDIINTFNNSNDQIKKKMIRNLMNEKFKTTDEFFNFVKLNLGISTWNRLIKKIPRKYAFVEDLVNNLKKHETNQLFNLLLNKENILDESIRDLMKPKTEDEIRMSLEKLSPNKKLIIGVKNNIFWLVKEAIEENADINIKDKDEYDGTPLIHASAEGYLDIVKYLVENGADINSRDNFNNTSLLLASYYGNLEMVKYLVENGADIDIKDTFGKTALNYASINRRLDVVNYLKSLGKTNESIRDLMKPKPKGEIMKIYLNLINKTYFRPFKKFTTGSSLFTKKQEIIELLGNGDLSLLTYDLPIYYNLSTLFKEFLTIDEEPIEIKAGEITDLIRGTWLCYPNKKIAGLIHEGLTIAWVFDKQYTKELIEEKLKVNESIRDLMKPRSEEEIRKTLDLSNMTSEEKLMLGVQKDLLWLVKQALEEGTDVNYEDSAEWTPLMYATMNGYLDIVKYLVENYADINIMCDNWTPLMNAAFYGYLEIVKYLLEKGADINMKNDSGKTVLNYASTIVKDYLERYMKYKT